MKYNLERFTGNRRVVEIADGATKGATVGVDLFYNGVLVLWEDIYNGGGGGTPSAPGTTITAWSLILDIPANVTALANTATTGLYAITAAGTSATRAIEGTVGRTTISNGSGVAGNPTVDLAVRPDTGIGAALVKTTRDAYGRVEGTESATTDDLAEGATNLYFPEAPIDGTPYARQDAAWVAAGGGGMTNPMTTLGDIITADTGGVPKRIPVGANGKVLTVVSGEPAWATGGASGNGAVGATFDGGGAALTPGVFTDVFVPFNCTIVGATLLADTTGNLVVSVLADPYASFPPTTDLAPTTPPTISGSDKSQDTTLSGWSTAIAAGDVVRLGVVSCSSITRATLSLEVTKP